MQTYFPKWRARLTELKKIKWTKAKGSAMYIRDWGVAMADSEKWNSCAIGELAGFPTGEKAEWLALDITSKERHYAGLGSLPIDFVAAIYNTDADAATAILDQMDRLIIQYKGLPQNH